MEYTFEPDGECFKFGASRVFKADFAAWLPVKVGSLWIVVRVAVVACDVPFLLGRPALKKLKAKIDLGGEHVGFGVLNGEDFPLVQAQGGHPAIAVFPDGGAKPPRLDWAQVRDLGRNNGVWYPSAVQAYMARAGVEQEIKGEGKKLFYAKKLPPAVQDMLGAKQVSSEAFLGWWKGTKVQKDFWIETPERLIRVHVVPRKGAFTPVSWNTSLVGLKQELLQVLGDEVVEERIPVTASLRHMSLPALWSLNKQGLTDELETYGITAHPDWAERNVDSGTVPKGLARMTLDQLKEEARKCNVVLPERPTKGALAKMIRDAHGAPNDTIVPFGKYRGWAYAQVPVPYLEWAAAEATQETASDDLKRIARWWTDQKKEKTNKAKGTGLPENDPERNWKLAPPPGAAAAGSDEWQRVSPATPSSRN